MFKIKIRNIRMDNTTKGINLCVIQVKKITLKLTSRRNVNELLTKNNFGLTYCVTVP